MPTKLIEVALPLDVINREAAREKSIRHGHPSTFHTWWARRPLAACRAVLFAQLVDDPSAHPDMFPSETAQDLERRRLFAIIERLVPWEATTDSKVLAEAHAEIRRCYPEGLPTIVDPFCGGGSIPLEAQRLGLAVDASDLNPVAVLITKALIELPGKFRGQAPVHPKSGAMFGDTESWRDAHGLAEDVRYYGEWMRDQAHNRIGHLYPSADGPEGTSANVIAWIWARTVTCPNPVCRFTMPLVRSFWLSKKRGNEAWINATPDPDADRKVRFQIGHGKQGPPTPGTVGRSGATCVICTAPVPLEYVRNQGRAGRIGSQLMAVVVDGGRRRLYEAPTLHQEIAAQVARPEGVPDTELFDWPGRINVYRYGMTHHADLFTSRQLVALCAFGDLAREARAQVLADSGGDIAYADTVTTYLAVCASKAATFYTTLARWRPGEGKSAPAFGRQAIPMTWDFAEVNPFAGAGGDWTGIVDGAVKTLLKLPAASSVAAVEQADARERTFAHLVVSTDPPYYDNIGYADLSDYFYIWLRRPLREMYPALFGTVLTPKAAELVATPWRFDGDKRRAEHHFETGFDRVFAHAGMFVDADTPMTVYYAFKQSEADETDDDSISSTVVSTGWETMLSGLVAAGLTVTGTWPLRTEGATRMIASGSNALASSIALVCRPRAKTAGVTDRRGFIQELKGALGHALRDLQSGGVAPVDLAQAAIGPGMAVFSRYAKVIEPNGDPMRVRTALALINQVLDEVSAAQEGEFDEDTRWAIAWYAEQGMDEGDYGRADDLSRAKNVSVDGLVRAGLVKSGGGKVRLLDRNELDPNWDPTKDSRLTVWEVTQHLIQKLMNENEASAAELLSKVGGLGDAARDLAYRLFLIAESKKWAKEAGPYNALAASWLDISRLAAAEPDGQGSLFSRD
jgi:putative DNA methylase